MNVPDKGVTPVAEGLWIDTTPAIVVGMQLTATMAVIRLGDGRLLLYSPLTMTPERRAEVEALGKVAHVYAPNLYHHQWVGEWAAAFPSAKVHAPADLAKKRPDLRIDRNHRSGSEPAFAGAVDELRIDGFRLEETVLYHEPTRTLVVADLVHNIGRPVHWWAKVYGGSMGFYDRVAVSRMLQWAAFSDKAAARKSVDAILALPFERIVLGHGAPITSGARDALAAAYRFLG